MFIEKYEISIWEDYEKDGLFSERKIATIGSDTMTGQMKASSPRITTNINGTKTLSFSLRKNYFDNETGEKVENPFIQYLTNERKIKLYWRNKWYDFLIKEISESSNQSLFEYSCESLYITELGKNGFNLEFDTELENNMGTAAELVGHILEGTDWSVAEDSDIVYQLTQEAVYEAEIANGFYYTSLPDGAQTYSASVGRHVVCFYSDIQDLIASNGGNKNIQLIYDGGQDWQTEINGNLITGGVSCEATFNWVYDKANDKLSNESFEIDLNKIFKYRAEKYIATQNSEYNDLIKRYANVYDLEDHNKILGYEETIYHKAGVTVANLITTHNNFSVPLASWSEDNPGETPKVEITTEQYPPITELTPEKPYQTSYLHLEKKNGGAKIYNCGLTSSANFISEAGIVDGEKYVLRTKAKTSLDAESYCDKPVLEVLIVDEDSSIFTKGQTYDEKENWVQVIYTCNTSVSYQDLLNNYRINFEFIDEDNIYIEDIEFFKYVETEGGIILPNKIDSTSVLEVAKRFFDTEQNEDARSKDEIVYLDPTLEYVPRYGTKYEKVRSITGKESNRFNLLQEVSKTFGCWLEFEIGHEESGEIIPDEKKVRIKNSIGEDNGIGFVYGIDLKSINRNLVSNNIVTKTIVPINSNEYAEDGFCSIARAKDNPIKENYILNFDYYINQGLLEREVVDRDLYGVDGYFSNLKALNEEYDNNAAELEVLEMNMYKNILPQRDLYNETTLKSLDDKLVGLKDELNKLCCLNDYEASMTYVEEHPDYEDGVKKFAEIQTTEEERANVYRITQELEAAFNEAESKINELNDDQRNNISKRQEKDLEFYKKYYRFIQEGTWNSENYISNDLYYLDALGVSYTSSMPQVEYKIGVVSLSALEGFEGKIFNVGDTAFVQDTEFFGYMDDHITPYKEKVIIYEITYNLDNPAEDVITVKNFSSEFDNLFQRINATTETLQYNEGKYSRAANGFANGGGFDLTVLKDSIAESDDIEISSQNDSIMFDNSGMVLTDNLNQNLKTRINGKGIFVTQDGGINWSNILDSEGLNTKLLKAGTINASDIIIADGEYQTFRWDSFGLNAYDTLVEEDEIVGVNLGKFVRFDRFGIYGMNTEEVFRPASEDEIWDSEDSRFGLTWKGFFLKTDDGGVKISNESGIEILESDVPKIIIGTIDKDNGVYGLKGENWSIEPNLATFKNIKVTGDGYFNNLVLSSNEVQAAGGHMFFKPSSKVVTQEVYTENGEQKLLITIQPNDINLFNKDDTVLLVTNGEQTNIVTPAIILDKTERGELVFDNVFNESTIIESITHLYSIIKEEDESISLVNDLLIGINANDTDLQLNSEVDSLVVLSKRSLTFSTPFLDNGVLSGYDINILLGDLSGINKTGYGLYADNVYLNGTLSTKTTGGSYAGVNTLTAVAAPSRHEGNIVFWGGAEDETEQSIQNSPFYVTDKGEIYANKLYIENSAIIGTTIKASRLEAPVITGLEENGNFSICGKGGIDFFESFDYEREIGINKIFSFNNQGIVQINNNDTELILGIAESNSLFLKSKENSNLMIQDGIIGSYINQSDKTNSSKINFNNNKLLLQGGVDGSNTLMEIAANGVKIQNHNSVLRFEIHDSCISIFAEGV